MRCPKCGFISFDRPAPCGRCGRDLQAVAAELGGTVFPGELPAFLAIALAAESAEGQSLEDFADQDEALDLAVSADDWAEPERELELAAEPESQVEQGMRVEPEPEPEPEPETGTEVEPELPAQLESAADEPESESQSEPELQGEPEPELEPEPESELELALEPEFEPGLEADAEAVAEPLDLGEPAVEPLDLTDLPAVGGAGEAAAESLAQAGYDDLFATESPVAASAAEQPAAAHGSDDEPGGVIDDLTLTLDDDTPLGTAPESAEPAPEIPDLELILESDEEDPKTS